LIDNKEMPDRISIEAQMGIFWRILHFLIARYGNNPMGQLLVTLSMIYLNERGLAPTLTDLCEATGLPKASVSRYVSEQIKHGLVREQIDPADRRRRYLVQTAKGKREWLWQVEQLEKQFDEITAEAEAVFGGGPWDTAEVLMEKMIEMTQDAPPRLSRGPGT
jgi:DNA-binding MarR family transcriptional regulator